MSEPPAADEWSLVLTAHGARARVRLPTGEVVLARAAGRDLQFVCGDRVRCVRDAQHPQWQIEQVGARHSALYRSNVRGRSELVVANLAMVAVVIAPRPRPDLFLVDRYVAAAASTGLTSVLITNKADLGIDEGMERDIADLAAVGCVTLSCSARTGDGLPSLSQLFRGQVVMLAGQSGVGKSSLLRALIPGCDAPVGELLKTDEGRHTTSAARLYDLPADGALIDAPGVRDFAPGTEQLDARTLGFVEIGRHAGSCRFADCRHLKEPDCAVRAALAAGSISARRYESYRRLLRLRDRLLERQPYARS